MTTRDDHNDPGVDFFGAPVSTYTRAQALADGELVDVTLTAREAGYRWPTALTRATIGFPADF